MIKNTYDTAAGLIGRLSEYGCIHVECNRERMEELFHSVKAEMDGEHGAFLMMSDKGYERQTVKEYLNFFHALFGETRSTGAVLKDFGLTDIRGKRMRDLKPGEQTQVHFARISMQNAEFCYLEEPLANLDEEGMKRVLGWIERQCERGVRFVTASSSLRYALMMPGTAFYEERGSFYEVEKDDGEKDGQGPDQTELEILKIPARSGASTLLFDPGDIDYVESLNKCCYLSVRGSLYQTQQPMYELEETLKKAGFFRCHRSYLVNVQKVDRFEKWTKNSFVLILNNTDKSQIPLSKGRIDEMKETFHW